ncbi:MAG: hypothetical protein IT285_11965 [Bdellovibrionales bacterium]|nr:hypothetical protein [Bdellovibrionales bacterium]
MKRQHSIWLAAVLVAALAGGCFDGPPKEPTRTIRLSVQRRPVTLDPALATDGISIGMTAMAYEGLYQYHYLKRPYRLEPLLADGFPAMSADRRELRLRLKKGVLFHDDASFEATRGRGREMTAADVVYSLKRLADPRLKSPGWWAFEGKIAGLDDWRARAAKSEKTDYSEDVEGLRADGRYALSIKLSRPLPRFTHHLASSYSAVVAQEAVEKYGDAFAVNPVGTGAFRLDRGASLPGTRWTWLANRVYGHDRFPSEGARTDRDRGLLKDAGARLPLVDRVELAVIPDATKAAAKFAAGDLEVWVSSGQGPPSSMPGDVKRASEPVPEVVGLVIHLRRAGPLKNRALRQALARSVDRGKFIELFYPGGAQRQVSPVPSGLEGGEMIEEGFGTAEGDFDPVAARKLLRKAGYPGGIGLGELVLLTPSEGAYPKMAEFIKLSLAASSITVAVRELDGWEEFLRAAKAGEGDLWFSAWSADLPDAENFLQLHYGRQAIMGSFNESGFSHPGYDQWFDEASVLPSGAQRTALNAKMAKLLVYEMPWVWLLRREKTWFARDWVRNLKPHAFQSAPWKYLGLELGKIGKND